MSPPSLAYRGIVEVDDDFEKEYPGADRGATELFATLLRTGSVLNAALDRAFLASIGENQQIANTLAVIEGADTLLTPSEISDRTLIPSATLTSALDRLERRGWVRRLPNPDDRRSLLIEITEQGRASCDEFLPGIHQMERRLMSELDGPEKQHLLTLLSKVLRGAAVIADTEPGPLTGERVRPRRSPSEGS